MASGRSRTRQAPKLSTGAVLGEQRNEGLHSALCAQLRGGLLDNPLDVRVGELTIRSRELRTQLVGNSLKLVVHLTLPSVRGIT
jgi:hypothetical protein